jgi:hypothetical protein
MLPATFDDLRDHNLMRLLASCLLPELEGRRLRFL